MSADAKAAPTKPEAFGYGAQLARIESKLDRLAERLAAALPALARADALDARLTAVETELGLRDALRARPTDPAPPPLDAQ